VEIRVLGPVELVADQGEPVALPAKQRRLLAALAADPAKTRTVDFLADAIWGRPSPGNATKALQLYVSRLRKVLSSGIRIRTDSAGYALELDDDSLDAARFERLLAEATVVLEEGNARLAASMLGRALSLWRGPAFGELAYEDFARPEGERLEELRLHAAEERLEAQLRLGEHTALLGELRAFAVAHPLRERTQAQLMTALYRSGRQTEALDVYGAVRGRLRDELGLEPGPELGELQRRILTHDPTLADSDPTDAHFLLPSPATPLLGRERELRELGDLLERRRARLVVLTGAGGSGKTRLALEAARQNAASFADGAALVELAPLRDPSLVAATISSTLGLRGHPGDPLEALVAALHARELLLVLDNAEHLRAAAPIYSELLAQLPRLTLLVTSRSVLHLSGERVYPVEPLTGDAAVELFRERAREADPRFHPEAAEDTAIRQICDRLDRLPLAIEIAASRTRGLTAAELLERLDPLLPLLTGGQHDLPERQQTVRATIEWSYDLLDEHERRDFARLSVFAGGSTLEAAEVVCESSIAQLTALVDQHLVRRTVTAHGSRFDMLETIREFAGEQLERSGEEEVMRRRHADHYLTLAEEAAPEVERGRPRMALERLAVDHDNLRAALDTLETLRDTQGALALAGALWPFWMVRGNVGEARRGLERALAADPRPTRARARALIAAAQLTAVAGPCDTADLGTARCRAEEAMQLFVQTVDPSGAALARWVLAWIAEREGEWASALDLFEASVDAFRALADDHFVLAGETHRAFLYEQLGEHLQARALHDDNLRRARSLGNDRVEALALGALATYAVAEGRLDDAWEMVEDAYAIHQGFGFAAFLSVDLMRFAAILVRVGKADTAAQLAARAARLAEDLTAVDEPWTARERDETTALIRTQLDDAAFAEAWSRGRELSLDVAFSLALDRAGDVESHGRLRHHDSVPPNRPSLDTGGRQR
jgi:predicted ATPase/DNA-binding SARP family transcriptional activator